MKNKKDDQVLMDKYKKKNKENKDISNSIADLLQFKIKNRK